MCCLSTSPLSNWDLLNGQEERALCAVHTTSLSSLGLLKLLEQNAFSYTTTPISKYEPKEEWFLLSNSYEELGTARLIEGTATSPHTLEL